AHGPAGCAPRPAARDEPRDLVPRLSERRRSVARWPRHVGDWRRRGHAGRADPARLLPRLAGPREARLEPATSGVTELPSLCLRLFRPEPHTHLAVHRQREPQMRARLLRRACATVELAEAQMAMRDEGTHAELLRQREAVREVL